MSAHDDVAADSFLIDLIRLISNLFEKENVDYHLALGNSCVTLRFFSPILLY